MPLPADYTSMDNRRLSQQSMHESFMIPTQRGQPYRVVDDFDWIYMLSIEDYEKCAEIKKLYEVGTG